MTTPIRQTLEDLLAAPEPETRPAGPGLRLIFSSGQAHHDVLPVRTTVELGRNLPGLPRPDVQLSQRHASVKREGGQWVITDHASRNGTFVDGERIQHELRSARARVLRAGQTVFLLEEECSPHPEPLEQTEDTVIGPRLRAVWSEVIRASRTARTLVLGGETGVGKEVAARVYHDHGPRKAGPFVAVNCAAIPPGIAERLLFGARRGAFSGATSDADGYVQAAEGGTLFLDEIAELDLTMQAKLLRLLEAREVLPVGASRPRVVDVSICAATHQDLRGLVMAGRFRADLFYRLVRPTVVIPPLRERPEDVPALVVRALRRVDSGLFAHASLMEVVLQRPWPGNVRELNSEISNAGERALAAGRQLVTAENLPAGAGTALTRAAVREEAPLSAVPDREVIAETLRQSAGNVSRCARLLGIHRTQLRRWMERYDIRTTRTGTEDVVVTGTHQT